MKKWMFYGAMVVIIVTVACIVRAETKETQEDGPMKIQPVWTDVQGEMAQEGYYQSRRCEWRIEPASTVTKQALESHGLQESYTYHEDGHCQLKVSGIVDEEFVIDHTKPSIHEVMVSGSSIQVTVEEANFNPLCSTIAVRNGRMKQECLVKWEQHGTIWTGSLELQSEGIYTEIFIRTIDLAGNRSDVSKKCQMVLDTTGPSIAVNVTSGVYAQRKSLRIQARDELSEVVSIQYRINGGAWNLYQQEICLEENQESKLEIRAQDAKGNISYTSGTTVAIDTKKPVIHVTSHSHRINGIYVEPPVFKVTLDDHIKEKYSSGVKQARAKLIYSDGRIKEQAFQSGEEEFRIPITKKEERVTVQLTCVDYAGNIAKVSIPVEVDMSAPEVYIQLPPKEHRCYASKVRARILMKDANVSFAQTVVKNNGVRQPVNWVAGEQGYAATIELEKAGEYQITVTTVDLAGNRADDRVSEPIIIDMSPPQMELKGVSDSYINQEVKISIVVRDAHYDEKSIQECMQVRRNQTWENVAIQWVKEKDICVGTFLLSREGDYVISGSCKDKAGWESNVLYQRFVLDKTAPKVSVSHHDRSLLDEDSKKPSWQCVDPNLNASTCKLYLSRNEEKYKLWKQNTANYRKLKDGSYRWVYYAWDKAGNATKKEGSFILNRHGSLAAETEYTKALSGNKVGKVTEDILLYEKNPTPLKQYRVSVYLDGKKKKLVAYGKGSGTLERKEWKKKGEYHYSIRIPKENFKSQGVYRVKLESKDSCQHVYRRKMTFAVERGKPSDILKKENQVEAENSRYVIVIVFSIGILGAIIVGIIKKRTSK